MKDKKCDGSRVYMPFPLKMEIQACDLMVVDGHWS